MKKEKKRLENVVLIQDVRTGNIIEQKVDFNEIKRKQIEEKSRKKCQAFLDIVPTKKMVTIHENDIKTQGVNDYFDFNTEKTIDLGNVKTTKQNHEPTKLSKLDLIF